MSDPQVEREYRFLLSRREACQLLVLALQHLRVDVHERDAPIAFTRTTYFDTAEGLYRNDEESGLRRRVRIRQYASAAHGSSPPVLAGKAYLEYKESIGAVREKQRFVSAPMELIGIIGAAQISPEAIQRLQASPRLAALAESIRLRQLRPVFSTWYRRVALSKDNVRLTIDEDVALCPPLGVGLAGERAEPLVTTALLPGQVLELKVVGDMPAWLTSGIATLHQTATFSKFRWGMSCLESRFPTRDRSVWLNPTL